MKKLSIFLTIALVAIIYSCGNSEKGSNEQKADSLATKTAEQVQNEEATTSEQAEPQITLTVTINKKIHLELAANENNTPVKIVSGERDTAFMVGDEKVEIMYLSGDTKMTIYGNITKFDCAFNNSKLTAVDVSKNTGLTNIRVDNNSLNSLDVSNNKALDYLSCNYNRLTHLDLSNNTALKGLYISDNRITTLDLSKNKALQSLEIGRKSVAELYTQGISIDKNDTSNRLISLDLSHNTNLSSISSFELSIECYNSIIKSLPDRKGMEQGEFEAQHHDFDFIEDIDTTKNWSITTRYKLY